MKELLQEQISALFEKKEYAKLRGLFKDMRGADLAVVFEELAEELDDEKDMLILYRLLPKDLAADVFAQIGPDLQQLLVEGFTDHELEEVLEQSFVDDTVDMIEEMPANIVSRILRNCDAESRNAINEILKYPKYSAGSIMTIEYVDLKRNMTVEDAFTRIRRIGVDKETIYTCYVKDENRRLIGLVSVKTLLLSEKSSKIEDIMETNIVYVNTHEDQETVASMFRKYDFLAMPVVDSDGRLVGIVTFDDVIDVIQEENTEDIEKMAAITPSDKPYMKTGVVETWKKRIPWLLLLMISATFTGTIINAYESKLQAIAVLTSFIPMFMDTAGNAGGQSSVTIIRGMSLDEIAFRDWFRVIWKEARVAVLCGVTLAAANFVKLMVFDRNMTDGITIGVAMVVCATLLVTIILAKIIGCTLPMAAKRVGFDPAVMASPFITTIVDALSLIIYFKIAGVILGI